MNTLHLQDLVKGRYGRKIAYTDVGEITVGNVVKVVGNCIGIHNWNKRVIGYLWDYYKGDQPIRYREKVVRDDILNKVVENHAYEIVQFKTGQTYGEPVQSTRSRLMNCGKSRENCNIYLMLHHKVHHVFSRDLALFFVHAKP